MQDCAINQFVKKQKSLITLLNLILKTFLQRQKDQRDLIYIISETVKLNKVAISQSITIMADNNPQKVNNALLRRKNNFFVKKS